MKWSDNFGYNVVCAVCSAVWITLRIVVYAIYRRLTPSTTTTTTTQHKYMLRDFRAVELVILEWDLL